MSNELPAFQRFDNLPATHGTLVVMQQESTEAGTLFFDPRTCRTYQVDYGGNWVDVSLVFPVNDYEDYRIRWQNMHHNISNYMPTLLPPAQQTEDIDFEEVPFTLLT